MNLDFLTPGGALKGRLFASLIQENRQQPPVLGKAHVLFPFAIDHLIGQGGYGSVYRAKRVDGKFEQTVAIKVFSQNLVDGSRFARECNILAKLEHPNIARIIDAGTNDEQYFWYAMEYCDGRQIIQHFSQNKIDWRSWLNIFCAICDALDYAHSHGVIHGDIKPANVLIDANHAVKIVDFGVARLISEWQGSSMMTLAYASPEQAQQKPLTTASDIYQVGVLLTLLTEYLAPDTTPNVVVNTIRAIATKCSNQDPHERYISIASLHKDLRLLSQLRTPNHANLSTLARVQFHLQRHTSKWVLLFLLCILFTILWNQHKDELMKEQRRTASASYREAVKSNYLSSVFQQMKNEFDGEKMRQQLDRAARISLATYKDRPKDALIVADTLATAYLDIKAYERAQETLESIVQSPYLDEVFDTSSKLELYLRLAFSYLELNKITAAQQIFERASKLTEQYTLEHDIDIHAYFELIRSQLVLKSGDRQKSRSLLVQAANRFADLNSPASRHLAELYRVSSFYFEGEAIWDQADKFGSLALAANQQLYGELSSVTLDNARDVMWYRIQADKLEAAFQLIDQQYQLINANLGENTLDNVRLLGIKGNALYRAKHFDQAAEVFRLAIRLFYEGKFDDVRYEGLMHHHLASALLELRQWRNAIDEFKRSIDIRRLAYHGDTTAVVPAHYAIAQAYCELSDAKQSLQWFHRTTELQKTTPYPDKYWLAQSQIEYATCMLQQFGRKTYDDIAIETIDNLDSSALIPEIQIKLEQLMALRESALRHQ